MSYKGSIDHYAS